MVAVQQVRADVVQVTGVRLNPTPNGLEVILETSNGTQSQSFTGRYGNTFFADVINTRLRLTDGETFRANNPTNDIESVTVSRLDANSIRIKVIGKEGIPTAQLAQNNQRLVFRLTAPEATAVAEPSRLPSRETPTTGAAPSTETPTTPPGAAPSTETPTTGTAPSTGTATTPPDAAPSTETPATEPGTTPPAPSGPGASSPAIPPQSGQTLPERVIVSVTRTDEELSNVPRSITVITSEQLEEQTRVTRDLGETLSKVVPGLAPPTQSASSFGQSLRGRNVLVLIDGVPQSTSRNVFRDFGTIDPSAIERVEVLRGPTAIYGDGATGGVINIITRRPGEERLTSRTSIGFDASLTHFEESLGYDLQHSITGNEGIFDFVISAALGGTGSFFDAEGDRIPADPNGQGGIADAETINILGKVGVNFSEDQRLQLTFNHLNDKQASDFSSDTIVDLLPGRQKARALEGLDLEDGQGTENTLINLDYSHNNVFGSQVQAQVYYRNYLTRFFPFDVRGFQSFGDAIIQSRVESEKYGGRLQIDTPLFNQGAARILWGLDYFNENTSQPVSTFNGDAYDASRGLVYEKIGERIWTPPLTLSSLGVFAQLTWDISDRFILNGGVRHERAGVSVDDFTTLAGNNIQGGDLDFNATLFNIGAVAFLNDQVNVFANFSQGFSLADIGLRLRNAPAGFSVETLRPEPQKVNNYEIGVRGNWQSVQASLAAFYNESDLGTTFTAPGTVIRAPEQVYGIEATIDTQLGKAWQLGGTITYVEGQIDVDEDGEYEDLDGFRIPPLKLTAYIQHQTTPGWSNRLQLLYSGSRDAEGSGFGLNEVESYLTVDYISSIKVGPGTFNIGVENLFNAQYFPIVSQLQTEDISYSAARGRTLRVGYSFTW
nr:TonB-dependent receptor [Trichocoleus sp. FACHB-90]